MKRDQASQSRFLGGSVPFGYKLEQEAKGARLVEVPEQRNAIKEMVRLKEEDTHSDPTRKMLRGVFGWLQSS